MLYNLLLCGAAVLLPWLVVRGGQPKRMLLDVVQLVLKGRQLWLRVRGLTPTDVAERRVCTGESWAEFCDTLKAAGASLQFPGAPSDAFSQAEGYRYLSRLARAGLENFVENSVSCWVGVKSSCRRT